MHITDTGMQHRAGLRLLLSTQGLPQSVGWDGTGCREARAARQAHREPTELE